MDKREIMRAAAIATSAAAAETLGLLAGTRSNVHMGDRSHNSLSVNKPTGLVLDAVMTPYTDPSSWGATHIEGHHKLADANVKPYIEIADALNWHEGNPYKLHFDPPEYFDNLDYIARGISLESVWEIGSQARDLALEGGYEPKDDYTQLEFDAVFDSTKPRFVYENMHERAKRPIPGQWPADKQIGLEDVWFRLMDPHSPSLHPEGPKLIPFFRDMIPLMYSSVERNWDSNQQLPDYAKRDELQQWHYEHRKLSLRILVLAHALGGAAIGIAAGERKPAQIAKNGLAGAAVIALAGVGLIAGGTITNYFGHLGADPMGAVRTGKITPHEDGSLATNGHTLLSALTLDEAGWQGNHHNHPDRIDFGDGTPSKAPVGYSLKRLADKGLLGLGHGSGFNDPEHRPDEVHQAVKSIQHERVRTIQSKST